MTRARERLILSGATRFEGWAEGRGTGGGPVAWIAPAFVPELARRIAEGGGEVALGGARVRLTLAMPGGQDSTPPAPPGAPSSQATPPPVPQASPPVSSPAVPAPPVTTLSYTSLAAYARCGYRFYCERVLGLPEVSEPRSGRSESEARSGSERGVLLHALLERLNFRRPVVPGPEAVAAVAADAGLAPPTPDEARELSALVARFASSELCARLARATETRREERFAFELAGSVLVTGAIDVLARERDRRMVIVDYKSDRLEGIDPAAVVQSTYATQRLVYALAALHAGAETVEVAHCFLEAPERPVTAAFDRSQLPELELAARTPRRRGPCAPVRRRPRAPSGAVRRLPGRGRAMFVAARGHAPPVPRSPVLTWGATPWPALGRGVPRSQTGRGVGDPPPARGLWPRGRPARA